MNHGEALVAADPLHKLIFSVHTYLPADGIFVRVSDVEMTSYMAALHGVTAPIVLGELTNNELQSQGGIEHIAPINYQLLMTLSAEHNFGYLIWWWGLIEAGMKVQISSQPTEWPRT